MQAAQNRAPAAASGRAEAPSKAQGPAPASLLRIAVRIAEHSGDGAMLYVATDETRARTLAEMVQALLPQACVICVPASDALPGDDAPASPALAGQRVAALRQLHDWHAQEMAVRLVCITSASATGQAYAAPEAYAAIPPLLRKGEAIDIAGFEEDCVARGYVVDDRIDEPGEVAVRGGVVDVYPVDAPNPVRIQVEDGSILAIRTYDPADQRTLGELEEIEIGRAREPEVVGGETLLAHFSRPGTVIEEKGVVARRESVLALARDAARFGRKDGSTISAADWDKAIKSWEKADWSTDTATAAPRFVERKSPLAALDRVAKPVLVEGGRIVLLGTERDLRFLRPRLARRLKTPVETAPNWAEAAGGPSGVIASLEAPADAGFVCDDLLVVAAADLLGSRALTNPNIAAMPDHLALDGLAELHVGDLVVHEDHGIARLCGIEALPGEDRARADAIVLGFAGDTRRLVPAREANRIWRYGSDDEAVTLDKLDGSSWERRRAGIETALAETAKGLVALAAARADSAAPVIEPDPAAYERFAATFPFTETPDQARAIAAVRDDLASGKPMDRLVIGDVGYGKTEVALRAAALVALGGGQAVVTAPTTVLVRQHLALFTRRFEGTGITVAGLSRLSTAAEKKAVKTGLADGSIQIVIGTAAVAAKSVRYDNLQLVVIDEEQRFGAADKARLRGLHDGHMLTLSATPIPRTLQSALVGLQQMSVIATPPARRQPIRTVVESWDDGHVRAALLRERARRGQSFVVVPRIEDTPVIAARLAKLFPEGDVIEAHGKMAPDALDTAMTDFAAGRGDVLLATNIIEAGLDVPRANTMIVWRADRFGLSELHQLRGRVGRGSRRGQILLLTDGDATIADATLKRLRTLQAFDRLGAGFSISARDLDMRGAGDLLGESQTGHMKLIGVDLYQHLLGQALRAARGEHVDDWQPELRVGIEGHLPDDWLPDSDLRLQLYGRLARLQSVGDVDVFEEELADRFGAIPDAALELLALVRLRILARMLGIRRIDAGPAAIALTPDAAVDPAPWIAAGFAPSGDRLVLKTAIADLGERLSHIEEQMVAMLEA